MAPIFSKPEEQEEPLKLSQSKGKKLIEELTESSLGEEETEEGNIAKSFLQGIWHGNAVPRTPSQKKREDGDIEKMDSRESDSV